jgi:hypothetical protein
MLLNEKPIDGREIAAFKYFSTTCMNDILATKTKLIPQKASYYFLFEYVKFIILLFKLKFIINVKLQITS